MGRTRVVLLAFVVALVCGLWSAAAARAQEPGTLENVLVFSKTGGFRHDSIPQGIAAIQQLGQANGFTVTATEDAATFTDANLADYDVVVFLSTTGEVLDDTQQAAFERFIQAGGGYAGIHAASDTEYSWPWYGELVGGYFRTHPPGTPTATVDIEDADEPSTTGLPASWTRVDEWYNFQHPTTPAVNGSSTIADFSPRARHVKVLATVDESTYGEEDGNTADDDHPVAWCSRFDGGISWYTAMGHTQASFSDENFRAHLLGGLRTAAGVAGDCGEPRSMPPAADVFEKVTLDDDTKAPMEIAIAEDGRVFYIELGQPVTGGQANQASAELMVWDPDTQAPSVAGTLTVDNSHENGLLGVTLAPDFAVTGHLYMSYSKLGPEPATAKVNRLSRFTIGADNRIVAGSEIPIYEWIHQRQECCHTGGSLDFGPDGSIYISTGDNTNPFAHGYNPTDERPGRQNWDAQRTSANTNSPNGKILRIVPRAAPLGPPGVGTTYDIPTGNMFAPGTAQTLPEIYAMGFRNPFRIHVDPVTDDIFMGDYGPDAPSTNPGRGPQGSVEFNIVKEPGFYGWPYCVRENVPYHDITYTENDGTGTDKGLYNCAAPVNDSPNNTGLTNLPAAKPATMWMGYSELDTRFPDLGGGGAPTGGTVYRYDEDSDSTTKFPRFYDGQWFIGEWNNDWIKTATWNDDGLATGVSCFAICSGYISPMDIEFGPDGSMYVVEWGQGFAENNPDSGVYRVDYVQGSRLPIATASVTPDGGPVPLEVTFSSAGSRDPDGTPITYAWDFGDGGTSTDPNPAHTYTAAGTYQARLTVTDESGATATDTVTVNAGNTRPVVTIEIPENGKVADFGDTIPYRVSVTDAEDGSTGAGINCDNIALEFKLGHDSHAHELSSATGCEGSFTLTGVAGHGIEANIFTVITAAYTDRGAGTAGPLTGRSEVILQPKLKQAEFHSTTGRTADGAPAGVGTAGVQLEATTDVGGGNAAAFIEDGDWISFNPYNLEDLDKVTFRVASGGAGGTIQLKFDDPNGPAFAETPNIAPTGGWQSWTDVTMDLPDTVPDGTHRLFVVFRNATVDEGLMNLNWFRFSGKGAANTAPPEVTAAAEPATGDAPLDVAFDAEATDAEGEALTYAWDFGVSGTTADTSTEEDPNYTYENPGNYTATVTVTDASGGRASASVEVRVTRPQEQCPTGPVRSDEFDGTSLDTGRWTVLRPDAANPFSVSGGSLNLPIANGSMYGTGTSAKNLIVQPVPDAGAWTVTAKITAPTLTENYHQAGLRLWSDDDNWASVHRIFAGTGKDVEFIYENDGQPRNEAADKLGGIPADAPATYYVRLHSDGTDVTASYSTDGQQFATVGRPAPLSAFGSNLQIGPAALSDVAPSVPVASFDWIRFDPDGSAGGGGQTVTDDFDGTLLDAPWTVTRQEQGTLAVNGGTLQIAAQPGDVYQTRNDAKNLALRPAPSGPWTATTKLNFEGTAQYHQAGIMVYGNDDNFTKFGRIAHTTAGDEKFEFINEVGAVARNQAADSTGNLDAAFPDDFWLRLTSDGTDVVGHYSTDGSSWTAVGRPAALPADAKIGLFAFSNDGTGNPIAAFDSFTLTTPGSGGGGGGTPSGPSYDDEFDGSSLDTDRWDAIVRPDAARTSVAAGKLNLTTSPGDIYTGDTDPPPGNFILQSADHAGADWVIETKIDSATINGGYKQGGLLAFVSGDNYVKFDAISDLDNTRINRLELRSEVAGVIGASPVDPAIAAGVTEIWLRLTKTGNSYAGAYSLDGTAWTALASPVTNAMAEPDFGLFAIAPQAQGDGTLVPFEYFTLDGPDPVECGCVASGDEFDGSALDEGRWNAIVREDDSLYTLEDGALKVTTVAGDIYTAGTPADTRNFLLQTPDHAGADWVIETKVSGSISGGYEQGGLLVYEDDGNYIKFDLISDENTTAVNRIELRSEEDEVIQDPQPQLSPLPTGTTEAWLRLTKTGDQYKGEYSFDGTTWTAFAQTVQNDMVSPRFGLFTLGVNSPGGEVVFDYFSVDGSTGCEEPPDNSAPVLGDVTATPTSGMAPLDVDFAAAATDADEDELTYNWEFGDGGTSEEQNPSHTYAQAGVYTAEVTVSDGEAQATKSVTVTVLGPDDPNAAFRALVFSKTTGFRHDSIPAGIAAIRSLGEERGFQVDATEDATVFTDAILQQYDVVVFLSTTGDPLNADQQAAFERYIRSGGGYAGIHAAADTEYDWHWYGGLVGAYFRNHPAGTPTANVLLDDPDHYTTIGLPSPWTRVDEWYNYRAPDGSSDADYSPRTGGVHVLATLDESTYAEDDGNTTDDDHPISWCRRYDGGRSWYTGMGHTQGTFSEGAFRRHLFRGLEVAAGVVKDADCGRKNEPPTVTATATPASGEAPLAVNFAATGEDADGDALTYAWTFGDGGTGTGATAGHAYATAGTYTATVTVTDADGATATASVTITVTTKPPPVVETELDTNRPTLYQFRTEGLRVTVTCGSDADGRAVVTLRATDATMERLDLDERRIGREPITCRPGRVIQLRMFPSAELERALKRVKPDRFTLEVLLAPPVGPTLSTTVTIRR